MKSSRRNLLSPLLKERREYDAEYDLASAVLGCQKVDQSGKHLEAGLTRCIGSCFE